VLDTATKRRIDTARDILVGLYGDPASAKNRKIAQRANAMKMPRRAKRELIVDFYDSESAHVWG
jgi:hypothetical protein